MIKAGDWAPAPSAEGTAALPLLLLTPRDPAEVQGWGGWWRDGAQDPTEVINALAWPSQHSPVGTKQGAGANPQGADPQGADPQGLDPQGIFHPG